MDKQKLINDEMMRVLKEQTTSRKEKITVMKEIIKMLTTTKGVPPPLRFNLFKSLCPFDLEIHKLIFIIISHYPKDEWNLLLIGTLYQSIRSESQYRCLVSLRVLSRLEYNFSSSMSIMEYFYSSLSSFYKSSFIRKSAIHSLLLCKKFLFY